MTLAASGQITTDQIMTELGRTGQQFVSNDAGVCQLAGKAVGAQILIPNDFWGKSSLGVSLNHATVFGSRATAGTAVSGSVTATPAGGNGTYAYSWTKVSGDAIGATAASSATTSFTGAVGPGVPSLSATFQVSVTSGGANVTATVTVNLQYVG